MCARQPPFAERIHTAYAQAYEIPTKLATWLQLASINSQYTIIQREMYNMHKWRGEAAVSVICPNV